jgi:DNA-binding LacI/PurR family transcriptional regulator
MTGAMDKPTPAASAAPTSADVARLAGVSRATVSYVLNDTAGGRVGEQTRERVRAAAEQLGYVPHAAARSLRAGHSGLVLLATPEVTLGPLFSAFFSELRAGLHGYGYTAVLYGSRPGLRGVRLARAWAELRPSAVLMGAGEATDAEGVATLKRSGARAVVNFGGPLVEGAHAVGLSHREVGAVAARHLLARGHRAIGVLMPTDASLRQFSEPRLAGAREQVAGFPDARLETLPLDYTEEAAAALAARWRSLGLTGLFCYNDEFAALVLAAFLDAGIAVPGEAALVGADDLMLSRVVRPRLSTVHIALPDGAQLAEMIDRLIREPEAPWELQQLEQCRLIARDSS